jgi:hypothetical protein
MIKLIFQDETHSTSLGPAPWFRIAGNFIRQGPHGSIAGTFRMHHWEVAGHHFARYDCKEGALVHFEDFQGGPSEDFGPFACLYAQDGVLHVEKDLFAKFIEETQMWHCFATETFWPVMVIKSVPGQITA